jgi:hypothetical protein
MFFVDLAAIGPFSTNPGGLVQVFHPFGGRKLNLPILDKSIEQTENTNQDDRWSLGHFVMSEEDTNLIFVGKKNDCNRALTTILGRRSVVKAT